ncbi:gluconate 2-dehydrogenase subunit 3 family protein [Candidatus Accumulibacter vicinus]|uniref:Uncharacterized protein n=1 Tax=Candidatus Accumulibacter vicinus TaxID=2954382 RepID=A0A084XZ57_9PROT|nr:gluconate 2-dehydrogenase subunit 3 family protein [Candidatus Accumulibacter vicinus]KFB67751.1 MAG: hypothetical protein CAPSK01_002793 [Candidatus Accumulibacter vicinus]
METKTEHALVHGLGDALGLQPRGYSRKTPEGEIRDCPDLAENPLNLFTLPYSELIEALTDTLFPPNQVASRNGRQHLLKASEARVDRHIHFRAAWQPPFGIRIQLALRDLTDACLKRYTGRHFAVLTEQERIDVLTALQKSALPPTQWAMLRPQAEAFAAIHEAVSCGLMAEPGYGGNAHGIGWFYTRFMTLGE